MPAGDTGAPGAWRWRELPSPAAEPDAGGRPGRAAALRGGVLLVLALIAAATGATGRAAVLVVLAGVVVAVELLAPAVAHRIDRVVARGAGAVGGVVAAGGALAVEVVIVWPGRLLTLLRRRDPLRGRSVRTATSAGSSWRDRAIVDDPAGRAYGRDVPGRRPRRRVRPVAVIVGLVALDLVLGTLVRGRAGGPVEQLDAPVEMVPGYATPTAAQLVASPALRGASWRGRLARELDDVREDEDPFVRLRPRDRQGSLVTVSHHRRRTVEPAMPADAPVVWLFGGSTMFGWGQRDGHTIASDVARLAKAHGHPVRVVNFGAPGDTAFNEAMRLEEALATEPAPTLAVFYDGANDVLLQSAYPSAQPTAFPELVELRKQSAPAAGLVAAWARTSLVAHLWPGLGGHLGRPIRVTRRDPSSLPAARRVPPEEAARDLLDVYRRSIALARGVAAAHRVRLLLTFQPARLDATSPVAKIVRGRLPRGVVDLSHVLDGHEADEIDAVQVNERGAEVVAAALERSIRRELGPGPRGG